MTHYSYYYHCYVQYKHCILSIIKHCILSAILALFASSVNGCSDSTGAATTPQRTTTAYWALRLNQHAVNLALIAPYTTIHLTATPVTVDGTPLTDIGVVTFRAVDSTVTVDSTGLVTAHYVTQQTPIVASLTARGVTLTDTAFVQVTDTAPQHTLTTFSLHPAIGDSAKRAFDIVAQGGTSWSVRATDAGGNTVCDTIGCALQVYYQSSNPSIATIDRNTGRLFAYDTGFVVFTTTTLAYGQALHDSVVFRIGYVSYPIITISGDVSHHPTSAVFTSPKILTVGVGAIVTFSGQVHGFPIDVVFDDSTAVDSASTSIFGSTIFGPPTGRGNIQPFGGDTVDFASDLISRRFPVPGVYRYHTTRLPSDTLQFVVRKE